MAQLSLQNVDIGYGGPPLLVGVQLVIEKGERLALVGRNGCGKSTLLKVLGGEMGVEAGELAREPGLGVARLEQQVPLALQACLFDVVSGGLGKTGSLLAAYRRLEQGSDENDSTVADRLTDIHHQLDDLQGWRFQAAVEETLSLLRLGPDAEFASLSSGQKRRALLGRCMVSQPDVLILDEPTNHLDLETILWLENYLSGYCGTLLLVSHDRTFVSKMSESILDLNRGRVRRYDCGFATYLQRKEQDEAALRKEEAHFDKKLAQEEVWIRQGIQARRTRNEGRVRKLMEMRGERSQRRDAVEKATLQVQQARLTGRKVIETKGLSFAYPDQDPIIEGFSTLILRGDRIGILGPNGCGKTTLIKLLLDQLEPLQGSVRHGTHLKVAYFDQLHATLDPDKTVLENVSPDGDTLLVNGKSRHVVGYLGDFLFTPEQVRARTETLSGGERNRLLLARLLSQPANVLVLDEPTNDLDVETLELLEEMLMDFPGTVLVVSHDRSFLNQVVTSTFAFEEKGQVRQYAGGYDDYVLQSRARRASDPVSSGTRPQKVKATSSPGARRDGTAKPQKRTWKESRELKDLPARIEEIEADLQDRHAALADPNFYKENSPREVTNKTQTSKQLEDELQQAYRRWEELESK